MPNLLEVSNLVKSFGGNLAVDGASFTAPTGSITGLIGPNGAGKTTCFNCITGALRPDKGTVAFNGESITTLVPHQISRRGLARTFQIPQELGGMTVLENLMLAHTGQVGEQIWNSWFRPRYVARQEKEIRQHAYEVMDLVDISHLALEYASELSGGQRKLLELGRALMSDPKMILLDEPSAGVNPTLALRLVDDIRSIQDKQGMTFMVIAHDMDLVTRLCDTLIVMTNGRILVEGPPSEVLLDADVQQAYLGSQYR